MPFNPSKVIVHNWPELFGFHCNVLPQDIPVGSPAWEARVFPTSPENVFSGDPGRPAKLPVYNADGVKTGSVANPAGAAPFNTIFLLFADEADARACLPQLWLEPIAS